MKVIAINGSPNPEGNTAFALSRVRDSLQKNGIETEGIEIGKKAIHGCTGCGVCWEKRNRRCVFDDDVLNSVTWVFTLLTHPQWVVLGHG